MAEAQDQQSVVQVLLPLMGEGVTEASVVKWLKKVGDFVGKGEPLLEVSTDKVDTEIPSPVDGTLLATLAQEGETVAVNKALARIGTSGNTVTPHSAGVTVGDKSSASVSPIAPPPFASPPFAPPPPPQGATVAPSPTFGEPRRSSPLVRKVAKEQGVDLSHVPGTGLGGRITRRDLDLYLGQSSANRANTTQSLGSGVRLPAHVEYGRLDTKVTEGRETLEGVPVRREKMSKMRTLIAEHMVRSVRTSPHVTTIFEVDMDCAEKLRQRTRATFQAREGFGLTFTAIFAYVACQAIKRHPIVNVSVDGDDILWKDQINLGVAVAIDAGLIVPVIRQAGDLNLTGVARRLNDIVTRARSKKLTAEDVQGGTFTVTNPGMFGSLVSSPIINQPQVAILSVGAIIKRPVVINDMIGIRPMVQVGLTFDHRVVDGEGGAKYLATFQEIMENLDETAL